MTDGLSLRLCEFQRSRVTFATRCAREAAGVRGPASVCPVGPSSAAQSAWSSATSTTGTRISACVFVFVCEVVPCQ